MYTIPAPRPKSTLTEIATERLRVAILAGQFDQGGLTEQAICAVLDISRTPVRAALQVLAQEGLLKYAPQRGFHIRRQDPGLVAEAYEVRAVLEGLAARKLAEIGLTEAVEATLNGCVELATKLLSHSDCDSSAWREMNARVHETIIEAAGNDLLRATVKLAEGVPLAAMTVIADLNPAPDRALLRIVQADHEAILSALRDRRSARAEARMREHILVAGEQITATLSKRTKT
jgi:GntR family transcriptional regulator of vanillate catabolism